MQKGPFLMILAALAFTVMVGFVKAVRQELDALDVVFWRAVVALVLLGLFARPPRLALRNRAVFALRLLCGFGTMFAFYTAARGLPLADLTLVSKLQPILVALAAPLLLGRSERAGPGLWVVLVVGLGGCALILAPRLAVGSTWGLWALAGTLSSTGAHLSLRRLGATESTRAVVLWFQAGLLLLSGLGIGLAGRLPELPSRELWPALLGVGVFATAGQLLVTRAYAVDRAALVAAASYSSPVWAVVVDIAIFDLVPTPNVWAGGLLVVGGGLWLLRPTAADDERDDAGDAPPEPAPDG